MLPAQLGDPHARISLLNETDDLLGAESTLLHVHPLGPTDFEASRGTAQRGQVNRAHLVCDTCSVNAYDKVVIFLSRAW